MNTESSKKDNVTESHEIEKAVEEFRKNQKVTMQVELSVAEIFAIITIVQRYPPKVGNLQVITSVGEIAALKLHQLLRASFPRIYILLDSGWNLDKRKEN